MSIPSLPPGCTIKHGRYYRIERNRWISLSRVDEGEIAFWRAFYRSTGSNSTTIAGILLAFCDEGMSELRPNTRAKYEAAILTRLIPYCGHLPPGALTASHVAQYLEARKEAGAPVAANRERAALSSAMNFAMRRGWIAANPCHGVRRNRERPSRRYVEHEELSSAIDRAPPPLQDLLAVAYLTGIRQTDLVQMRPDQIGEAEILVDESKTGKRRAHEITPTVRIFLDRALARSRAAGADFVFVGARGKPWGIWGLQSAMRRLSPGFTFRHLRPKAASDSVHNVLGHGAQMLRVYQRREKLRAVK